MSLSSSSVDRSIPCGIRNLYPLLVKHPRCRPFFQIGAYGVICARAFSCSRSSGDSTIRFYDRDDVEGLGLDPTRVHLRARENLRALFDSGELPIQSIRIAGRACLVAEHGLATSCLLLPQLREKARGVFGFQKVTAAILRRNVLVVFADPGIRAREGMASSISRALLNKASADLRDGGSELEIDLFALDGSDPRPLPAPPEPTTPEYFEGSARTLVLPRPTREERERERKRKREPDTRPSGTYERDDAMITSAEPITEPIRTMMRPIRAIASF